MKDYDGFSSHPLFFLINISHIIQARKPKDFNYTPALIYHQISNNFRDPFKFWINNFTHTQNMVQVVARLKNYRPLKSTCTSFTFQLFFDNLTLPHLTDTLSVKNSAESDQNFAKIWIFNRLKPTVVVKEILNAPNLSFYKHNSRFDKFLMKTKESLIRQSYIFRNDKRVFANFFLYPDTFKSLHKKKTISTISRKALYNTKQELFIANFSRCL